MSAYYDLYETPSPDGKEDKKSLHARICPKKNYTQKEFVEHVATFQHLPKNVIGAALNACIDERCDLLADGNIVELGELGFFTTSLKCMHETKEARKAKLELLFLKQNVCINKNEYIQMSRLTRHVAIDELNKFIQQGSLHRRKMSRLTVYLRQEEIPE